MSAPAALVRLPDWPERLAEYVHQHRGTPFAWGGHDCVRFAAGAVQAMTGCQPLPTEWSDRTSAARALRRLGGLVPAVSSVLPPLSAPAWAQRGDVVLVQCAGLARRWLAVCDGPLLLSPGPHGLLINPSRYAVRAWGVGHG